MLLVRSHSQADCLLRQRARFLDACALVVFEHSTGIRILGIPVTVERRRTMSGRESISWRNLAHSGEQRLTADAEKQIPQYSVMVPRGRKSGREQRLRFRCDQQVAGVLGVEERLDTESIAGRE